MSSPSPSADLFGAVIAPPLSVSNVDLPALAEEGGAAFAALLQSWTHACGCGVNPVNAADLDTVALRAEALLDVIGEAQARRILAGRGSSAHRAAALPSPSPADAGALARQRGALAACCAALRVARPATGETPRQTLARLRAAAEEMAAPKPKPQAAPTAIAASSSAAATSCPSSARLLTAASLDSSELATLSSVAQALNRDYATRRAMLLKRLDVLTTTFVQAPRAADRREEMLKAVRKLTAALPPPASFTAADALAADHSLLELQRVAPLGVGDASVKRVRIGRVPDRGGRAGEVAPMATESYMQQERMRDGKSGGKGGKGGGGGRGGGGGGKGGGRGKGGGGGRGGGATNERVVHIEPSSGGGGDGGGDGNPREKGGRGR